MTGSLFLAQQLNGDNFPAWGRSRLLKVHPCSGGPVLRRHGNWPTVEPNCPVREAVHYAGLSYQSLIGVSDVLKFPVAKSLKVSAECSAHAPLYILARGTFRVDAFT